MALHERRNEDEWISEGRFFYLYGYDGGIATFQICPSLQREFAALGYKTGHSFKKSEVQHYIDQGLFYIKGEGGAGSAGAGMFSDEAPWYAENAPRVFHARIELLSEIDSLTQVAEARLLEWPQAVHVSNDVYESNLAEVDDEYPIEFPVLFDIWLGEMDAVPSADEFVRILPSVHPDSQASVVCERRYPESGEKIELDGHGQFVIDEFEQGEYLKIRIPGAGAIRTIKWAELVTPGQRLQAAFDQDDPSGERLQWCVVSDTKSVNHYTDRRPDGLLNITEHYREFVRGDFVTRGEPGILLITTTSMRSLPAFRWLIAQQNSPLIVLAQHGITEYATTAIQTQYPALSREQTLLHYIYECRLTAGDSTEHPFERLRQEVISTVEYLDDKESIDRIVVGFLAEEFPELHKVLLKVVASLCAAGRPIELFYVKNSNALEERLGDPFAGYGFKSEIFTDSSE